VLTVRWTLRGDTPYAARGHLVAWDQVMLSDAGPATDRRRDTTPARPSGASNATMAAIERLLLTPIELNLWRAPTDNDGFKLVSSDLRRRYDAGRALDRWLELGLDRRPPDELVTHRVERFVDVLADGSQGVTSEHVVDVPDELADLPRVGVTFQLPARFRTIRWLGRGPHENYPDRRASALLGVWEAEVDRSPYLMPQEFGLRTDCRWIEFVDGRGRTLRVDAIGSPMHFSATHSTAGDLYAATNDSELVPRRALVVCLDAAHRGLGTASCGPDVLPRYRLAAGRYEFSYRLSMHG